MMRGVRSPRQAFALVVAVAGLAAPSHSARAATFLVTLNGVAETAFHYDPFFDPTYTDLSGPFTLTSTIVYPYFYPNPYDDPIQQPYDYYINQPGNPLHRFVYPDATSGSPDQSFTIGYRSLSFSEDGGAGGFSNIDIVSLADLFPTIAQLSPIDIDIGPGTAVTGTYESRAGYLFEPYNYYRGYLTHLTIALVPEVSAVPEPAAWMLMIVGFGAIGAGFRRRGVSLAFARA